MLQTFPSEAAALLPGPDWLRERRIAAADAVASMPLPSEKEEAWRYSPIDELDLGQYAPAAPPEGGLTPLAAAFVNDLAADLPQRCALVVLANGTVVSSDGALPDGVTITNMASEEVPPTGLGDVLASTDALVRLNDAFHPDGVVVDVAAGVQLPTPIVVVHWCDGDASSMQAPASFPRTDMRVARGAEASLVEVVAGAPAGGRALVVPVTELRVADAAHLSYVGLQVLGTAAWYLGRVAGVVERDATLRCFTVGLGGAYDRLRTDAAVVGPGGSTELRAAYLGTGSQVHDIRTLQDHVAERTTSDLLCRGAVAGTSRSIYSGLIRVRHGAVKTSAMQTNNNLVLDERAHADSVPNLDIEENDVRCSHASTVGPVDEDQRYYLESRGVPPEHAERLIVLGFFDDIVGRSPIPSVVGRLRREVGIRLTEALGITASDLLVPSDRPAGPDALAVTAGDIAVEGGSDG